MIRRLAIALCALLGAATLTSCSQFDRNDLAASVNGAELTQDELGEIMESELGADLLNADVVDGVATGDGARSLLSAWISLTAIHQSGILADADREQIATDLDAQFTTTWTEAPQTLKDIAVTNVALGEAARAGALTQEDVRAAIDGLEVWVDSRYGAWNVDTLQVVALG